MISAFVICNFNLQWYPFDTQLCIVQSLIRNAPQESTQLRLIDNNDSYITIRQPEFILTFLEQSVDRNRFNITFELHREVNYYIVSTFLPVSLLHIIGYGTMFIRFDNFQDRGTMSLTTLLVLIALNAETMSSLPVTSYMKFIDVWFLYSVIFLTIIIVMHLITNDVTTKILKFSGPTYFKMNNMHFFQIARIILGIGHLIFLACYIGIAVSHFTQ